MVSSNRASSYGLLKTAGASSSPQRSDRSRSFPTVARGNVEPEVSSIRHVEVSGSQVYKTLSGMAIALCRRETHVPGSRVDADSTERMKPMKTQWIVGTAALLATAAVGLQAQSSNGRGDQQSTITVTGCLQPDTDRGAVGPSGSSAGRPAAGAAAGSPNASNGPFVLVNARVGSAPGGGSAVTSIAPPGSGTNESAARAGSAQPSPAISGAIDKNGDSDKSATG